MHKTKADQYGKLVHVYQHQKSVMHLLGEEKYNFVKTNMTFFKAE